MRLVLDPPDFSIPPSVFRIPQHFVQTLPSVHVSQRVCLRAVLQQNTEATFDGYVVEYSLDGGTTWSDILAAQGTVPANPNRFLLNPYNSTLSTGFNNPLPGRRAWSGAILAWQSASYEAGCRGGQQ